MSSRVVNFRAPNIRLSIFVNDPLTIPDLSDMDLPSDRIDTVDNDGLPALRGDLDEDMCTGIIDDMYILAAPYDADIIIVMYEVNESKKICLGFLLAKYVPAEKIFYISLVCTNPSYRGVGTRLIRIIKRIASKNDIDKITLDSVNSAKNFYSRRKFTKKSNAPTSNHMTYNMSTYANAERRPRKTKGERKHTKRRSTTKRR